MSRDFTVSVWNNIGLFYCAPHDSHEFSSLGFTTGVDCAVIGVQFLSEYSDILFEHQTNPVCQPRDRHLLKNDNATTGLKGGGTTAEESRLRKICDVATPT